VTNLVLRAEDGEVLGGSAAGWCGAATAEERALLARLPGPVLDVGCGPDRLVVALLELGVPALGVDTAPGAVAMARQQGASVLARSVFDRLPAEGRWGSAPGATSSRTRPPGSPSRPGRPAGLYRITQGLHVITGLASIPLLLAKLWAV